MRCLLLVCNPPFLAGRNIIILALLGTLAENHPLIVDAVLFAAAVMIIPEGFFLRGALRLFGFGPLGPTKGL